MLTRIAARKERKKGTKVLYTAHGFHFYKGAPLKSWLFYYTAEYFLSQYTDGIITMNREDFGRVNTKMMHKATFYIPGMGVDKNIFYPVSTPTKSILRNRYGFKEDEILIIYIAEFISRKNHEFIIESTVHIKKRLKNFRILFAGNGVLHDRMKQKTKNLGLDDVIVFLGFRNDIPDLIRISDIGISASKHEGLPIGILQELFSGLPVVVSVERGHNDLVDNAKNGYLFAQNDSNDFAEKIIELSINPQERIEMGVNSIAKAKNFELSNSLSAMQEIYNIYLKN
jgi:glycosyltransferase EpsD